MFRLKIIRSYANTTLVALCLYRWRTLSGRDPPPRVAVLTGGIHHGLIRENQSRFDPRQHYEVLFRPGDIGRTPGVLTHWSHPRCLPDCSKWLPQYGDHQHASQSQASD